MDKLLTAKQVSELLEVKLDTVYDWVHRGRIPYVKLGRLVRFRKTEVFQWVESHTIRSKSGSVRKASKVQIKSLQKEFPLS